MEEKYNQEWFKRRALESLEKVSEGYWDYSDSLLLYSHQGQQAYQSAQIDSSPYFELVTKQEHEYLKSNIEKIIETLPREFEYIDLGPGTENKESYFFNECKIQGKKFTYVPVDVSKYFLNISTLHAEKVGVEVTPILTSFEELQDLIGEAVKPRFISMLGLTFSNYVPEKIINLLTGITGKGGYFLVDVQLSERVNLVELQAVYNKYVAPACNEKIRLLGLDLNNDVSERSVNQEISIFCTLRKPNLALQEKGLKVGDKIKLFQSLRPTKEDFENQLKGLNYKLIDSGDSIVSVIVRT